MDLETTVKRHAASIEFARVHIAILYSAMDAAFRTHPDKAKLKEAFKAGADKAMSEMRSQGVPEALIETGSKQVSALMNR